nr:MAG TPA: hypothetical protein [Caudoviricetes sp.]
MIWSIPKLFSCYAAKLPSLIKGTIFILAYVITFFI